MLEPVILLGLIIYLILLYLSLKTESNNLFALCGVFFLLPMTLYNNLIIALLCAIGAFFHFILGWFTSKED